MCRGKNICTELGTNPSHWDRYALLRMPDSFSNSIDTFIEAVETFIDGSREESIEMISTINGTEMTEWFIEHGQMSGRHRKLILKVPVPEKLPKEQRDPKRSPLKIQNNVFQRDNYRCRYCGTRLISQEFLRLFIKKLNSPVFHRGETNITTHGIIHITWPVADHVIPWNYGGKTDLTNLVSSCAGCNYGKDGYTIEQLGIENPLDKIPIKDNWTGLTEQYARLKKIQH